MSKNVSITDHQRRVMVGETFAPDHITNKIVTRINNLATNLNNAETSPIEKRLDRTFIPINTDFKDAAPLISQTRSPLYNELSEIFHETLNDKTTDTPAMLLDRRLRPFLQNSFFAELWNRGNLPIPILEAIEPFRNGTLVTNVLKRRLSNLDKDIADLTVKVCATPSIKYELYKFVQDNYKQVKYLADTNPAIITLYIYTHDLDNPIEHEGEVIRMIREHLEQRHPNYPLSLYWKELTKRSHRSIYNHIAACAQQNLTYKEHPLTTELLIMSTIHNTHINTKHQNWMHSLNDNRLTNSPQRSTILNLLFKEIAKRHADDEWFSNMSRQLTDVMDYTRGMNPDQKINSTTWNGLLVRSDEWHRDQRAQYNMQSHDPNNMTCWNSLIDEPILFNEQNLIVTPLINSIQLYNESDEVQHCVRSYVDTCSRGQSRIFKIRPMTKTALSREKVGTMEIDLNTDGNWKVRQVRGIRNHGMSNECTQVAEQVAQIYNRVWTMAKHDDENPRHRTWTEPRTDKLATAANKDA